eukprot:TRINITY_DN13244_c0_g1_i1.p1 TRINITY_DN13244_c0_g1~~TRINITY_DN13244_c0_g1_i1.p1  ORF type:complete len:647 (+),score=143.63 TRINITY_DN13244_c0_g1_i1:47-1942(+)
MVALKELVSAMLGGRKFDDMEDSEKRVVVEEGLLGEAAGDVGRAAVLTMLTMQGETAEMVGFFSKVLKERAIGCGRCGMGVCDVVGTGGDQKNTLNISTPASIISSAMGLKVTKHGGRSASAESGSADVIEHLGGALLLTPEDISSILSSTNYCFVFAPAFQPALKPLAPVRKSLGFRTVLNLTGPLLNPTTPEYMVLGVGMKDKVDIMIGALSQQPGLKCLVVHSTDGMDKISPYVPTHSWLVESGKEPVYTLLKPADFGLEESAEVEYFKGGGGPVENSAVILSVLEGRASDPVLNFVYVQAAALAVVAGKAGCYKEGMELAKKAVSDGRPMEILNEYIRQSTFAAKSRSNDILDRILKRRTVDVLHAQAHTPITALETLARQAMTTYPPLPLHTVLTTHSHPVSIAAELKRASPSEGDISTAPILPLAATYAASNVQVISVLTEPVWFKGSLEDLENVRKEVEGASPRPAVLRKDFIFCKYQILEARSRGADTLLLIVAAKDTMKQHGESLQSLIEYSREWGMEPLVEVVTEEEVDDALEAGARVIGINNRDLKSFKVDLNRTGVLIKYAEERHPEAAKDVQWIALSGVSTIDHVKMLREQKASGVLVGTSLMRAENPGEMIASWQRI